MTAPATLTYAELDDWICDIIEMARDSKNEAEWELTTQEVLDNAKVGAPDFVSMARRTAEAEAEPIEVVFKGGARRYYTSEADAKRSMTAQQYSEWHFTYPANLHSRVTLANTLRQTNTERLVAEAKARDAAELLIAAGQREAGLREQVATLREALGPFCTIGIGNPQDVTREDVVKARAAVAAAAPEPREDGR